MSEAIVANATCTIYLSIDQIKQIRFYYCPIFVFVKYVFYV